MANHVVQRVESRYVVETVLAVPVSSLYGLIAGAVPQTEYIARNEAVDATFDDVNTALAAVDTAKASTTALTAEASARAAADAAILDKRGAANGFASLGPSSKIPVAQIPAPASIGALPLDGSSAPTAPLNMGGFSLNNLGAPTGGFSAVRQQEFESAVTALDNAKVAITAYDARNADVDATVDDIQIGLAQLDTGKADQATFSAYQATTDGYIGALSDTLTEVDATSAETAGRTFFNLQTALFWTRTQLRKLKLAGATSRVRINGLGDSWFFHPYMGLKPLFEILAAEFGDGGLGWCSTHDPASLRPNIHADVVIYFSNAAGNGPGSWVEETGGASPDGCAWYTSAPASDILTFGGSDATLFSAGIEVGYQAGAGRSIQYEWNNSGVWTTLSMATGSGFQKASISTGAPASGGWQIKLRPVTAATRLCGIYGEKNARGVIWNKLGVSGQRIQEIAANPDQPIAAAALAPTLSIMLAGINDQGAGLAANNIATDAQTWVTRVKTASPSSNILVATQPETRDSPTVAMSAIAAALRAMAMTQGVGFIDLQGDFGPRSFYRVGGSRQLMGALTGTDELHPSDTNGGPAVAGILYEALTGKAA